MNAAARATTQTAASDLPVAVVISPPWLRTGTGRVIEDQIAFYRDRGFATAFVGVPVNAAHVPKNPMWLELADAARELRADYASFAILDPVQRPRTLWRCMRQVLDHRTALDWIIEVGRCSRPPSALLPFLQKRGVALLHVNHVFTLGFARRLQRELGKFGRGLPLLVETHDVQSQILYDRAEPNPWTVRPDNLDSMLRGEIALLEEADVLVHCSVEDHRFFAERIPNKPQFLARPVIDSAFVAAVAKAGMPEVGPIDVLFVGAAHHANLEAVEWLLTKVWPLVAEQGLILKIVGGIADLVRQKVPELHDRFRSCFVGRVADLVPYYRAARSVIAPMRSGGGISIKTVEAFALGIPFVGTTKAYRGFPQEPLARYGIRGYDDPLAFADALARALSPNDDTGARGRALYEELFSREESYATRAEAVRIALDIHARPLHSRNTLGYRPSDERNSDSSSVEILALGSSNCVGPNSFIGKAAAALGARIQNLSIGACSSTLGVYQLDKVQPVQRGVAFVDFAINDDDAGLNLWGRQNAPRTIAHNIRTIAARLRSLNYFPILLLSASNLDLEFESFGHTVHREVCVKERINFIDLRSLVLAAIKRGASRNALMRDNFHLTEQASDAVSEFLAVVIRRMNGTSPTLVPLSASIVPSRVVHAKELFPHSALVARGSSLRSALYGRLAIGDVVKIPARNTERLSAIMINMGAKGGTVALKNDSSEIIKSMTAHWDVERPDWYSALLVDFAHPLVGGSAGLTIEIVDCEAGPTEATIHAKPVAPERYGEIEIEGVLLTGCSRIEFDHTRPSYDWMPLDLGELPEARHLSDRLFALQFEIS